MIPSDVQHPRFCAHFDSRKPIEIPQKTLVTNARLRLVTRFLPAPLTAWVRWAHAGGERRELLVGQLTEKLLDSSKESSHSAVQSSFSVVVGYLTWTGEAAQRPGLRSLCPWTSRPSWQREVLTRGSLEAGCLAGGGRRAQCSDRRGRERQRTEAEGAAGLLHGNPVSPDSVQPRAS